jgi:lysophospholipase L1-like esterase
VPLVDNRAPRQRAAAFTYSLARWRRSCSRMPMTKLSYLITTLALSLTSISAAHAEGVRILGRSVANPGGGFTIQWPSSGFEATFTGAQLTATIDDWGSNWLNVEIDGVTTTLDLREGVNTYVLFSGPAGEHKIRVTRRTGAQVGPTRILDIRAKGALNPTATPDRKILVIGDSITSGYGVECADRSSRYSHATQNAGLAYPELLAKTFHADLQSVSVDGRGLIRNFAGEDETMETVAWRILPETSAKWPTSAWQPQVIVINLGSNDFWGGDPGEQFDTAYVKMIHSLRADYPDAEIVATIGSLLDAANYTAARTSIQGAVEAVASGDSRVSFLELKPFRSPLRYGCDWHPGKDAHEDMAGQIQTLIEKRLGWTAKQKQPEANPALVWLGGASRANPVGH